MVTMYELPEEEKAHIQAEEIFRLAARHELEAREPVSSRQGRLWRILNSSFVLWFLSSVVVATIAAGFAKYQAGRTERIRQVETIRRLDTEIADRLFEARTSLCVDRFAIAVRKDYSPSGIYTSLGRYLDNSVITKSGKPMDFSVYPEYKNRTFRSLLFELSTFIDPSQVPLVRELFVDSERFADLSAMPENEGKNKQESRRALEGVLKKVNKYLAENRWRGRSMATAMADCGY